MPDNTVIDGEIVAFDRDGRPSFNALQNYGSAPGPVVYYVFDVTVLAGRDVMRDPLEKRRELHSFGLHHRDEKGQKIDHWIVQSNHPLELMQRREGGGG